MKAILKLAGITLALLSSSVLAASFDCSKAKARMETLICSDARLSKLDEDLNAAYKHALEIAPDKSTVKQWQREWLKSYEVKSCTDRSCLERVFDARIQVLNQVAATNSETGAWYGRYDRYWKGKIDKDSASILLVGLTGRRIYASGTALWYGANAKDGQVNTGELEGIGKLENASAQFDLDGCRATMQLKAGVLVVSDESGCGGLNVSFDGEYRKQRDH